MPVNITIDELRKRGACAADCRILSRLYPDGVVPIAAAIQAVLKTHRVNTLWAFRLLAKEPQISLAKTWFDRGLAGQVLDWETDLRAMIDSPVVGEAQAQIDARILEQKNAQNDGDLSTAGVGYAYATLVKKYAEGNAADSDAIGAALLVLSQWVVRSEALHAVVSQEVLEDRIQAELLSKLEEAGIA